MIDREGAGATDCFPASGTTADATELEKRNRVQWGKGKKQKSIVEEKQFPQLFMHRIGVCASAGDLSCCPQSCFLITAPSIFQTGTQIRA